MIKKIRKRKTYKYRKIYRKKTKKCKQKGGNNTIELPKNYNKEEIYAKMKQYNVIFGGTVRDSEKYIKENLDNIEKCGKLFNSFKVVIYENDSKDNTRKLLNDNKKDNYIYLFEDNITEPLRTVRLANGRNKVLNKIRELNKDNKYQYMIIVDLDDRTVSGNFINTIYTNFLYDDWDVLTGNQSDQYYDLWALRMINFLDYDCIKAMYSDMSKQLPGYQTHIIDKMKHYEPGQLLDVKSAFGGIAIYKLNSIPDTCKYIGNNDDGSEISEHVPFNQCLKDNNKKIYINTSFLTN